MTLKNPNLHVFGIFDINNTMTFTDSTKGKKSNPFISQLAERFKAVWKENTEEMSYKDFVQKIEFKDQDKYNPQIKEAQEGKINNFLNYLKEIKHPLYEKTLTVYSELEEKYGDKGENDTGIKIFPSFYYFVSLIRKVATCSVVLMTFGNDGKKVGDALSKNGWENISYAKMQPGGGLKFEGEEAILQGAELLNRLKKTTAIVQVSFEHWKENACQASSGKIVPCVADGVFGENEKVVSVFFDDNLDKKIIKASTIKKEDLIEEKSPDLLNVANPKVKNIAFPKDINNKMINWNAPGIIGISVDTIKAALDPNYFIGKARKPLNKRGITILN
ncbi:MAG: hypothetical protein H0X29_09645 [Parachlamydiaceae bacterium]|nr:hypothetical protein [Parachlamydiaceae bacterium]